MVFGDFFNEPKTTQRRPRPKFSAKEKNSFYRDQNGKCNGCEKKFDIRNLAVDHIKPFSDGQGERLTNLQLLCTACNSLKGTGTMGELRKKLRAQGLLKTGTKAAAKKAKNQTPAKTTTKARPANKPTARKPRNAPKDPLSDFAKDIANLFS
ncbi:MAG: HNH endonuclease signature motif containing protein [Chloroflexota bacterium]|nr:HNH endonuclease signature motif containing protein [Chloroflexota bacterium]